ncbi:hypothetical protein J132_08583 [Termitomyces sp. J132]|nr:hypothetical protein J132_08583 [Termitomyces sp. J132]
MSLSNLIRRPVRSVTILCRHGSSAASKSRPPRMLPDEKLRALVSLYHQADSFITLDNLSDRIDAAFTGHSTINLGSYTSSVKSMRDDLERRRMEARVTEWDKATANSSRDVDNYSQGWSRIKKRREIRVKHALHGMSDEGDLPGLEVVKDGIEGTKFSRQLHSDVRDLLSNKGPSNWCVSLCQSLGFLLTKLWQNITRVYLRSPSGGQATLFWPATAVYTTPLLSNTMIVSGTASCVYFLSSLLLPQPCRD